MRLVTLSLFALLVATAASGQTQTTLYPGLSGQPLLDAIRADYAPSQTLGYNKARDSLYSYENYTYGQVCGVYTRYCITLTPGADPSTDAYNQGVNAEHSWPQSLGAGSEPAKSDLHHLFPAKANVNSSRSNHPYGEIPDGDTDGWYREASSQSTTPLVFINEWSEKDNDHPDPGFTGRFEPREDHAGNAARAMFYFAAIYPSEVTAAGADAFFDVQKNDLINWHYQDPTDLVEDDRSIWIALKQGNENPFLIDSTLARRAFNLSGTGGGGSNPPPGGGTDVWVNEIHYDNSGSDTGEGVEIAGAAGTNLAGWSLAFYNGSGSSVYSTVSLSGTIPNQQGGYGTVWFAKSGIQNGAPDGIALVDASGAVVQFLSYEGTMTASGGPASGQGSTDIGVSESSSTPSGTSLQLGGTGSASGDFVWEGSQTATPGQPNVNQTLGGGTPPVAAWINEFHYDDSGSDSNEGIEIAGTAGLDLSGWSIALYNGNGGSVYSTINLSGTIDDEGAGYGARWFAKSGIQNGSPDGFALVDDAGQVVQFLSYEGTMTASGGPASGMTSEDVGVSEGSGSSKNNSLQLTGTGTAYADFTWATPQRHTRNTENRGQTFGTAKLAAADPAPEARVAVTVFPTPLRVGRTLRIQVEAADAQAVVYDALGREVARASGVAPSLRVETQGLSAGVYVVRVEAGGAVSSHTVTIVR
ncbi:MAG: endonuclease [Bacteroidota bacterium]